MNIKKILIQVRELLLDKGRWTKDWWALDKDGYLVDASDPTAVCWCLSGAIFKITKKSDISLYGPILDYLQSRLRGKSVVMFNGQTSHKKLLTFLDRAIAKAS